MNQTERDRFMALGRNYERKLKLSALPRQDRRALLARERLDVLANCVRLQHTSGATWAVQGLRETLGEPDEVAYPWAAPAPAPRARGPSLEPVVIGRILDSIMGPLDRMIRQLEAHDLTGAASTLVKMKSDVSRLTRLTAKPSGASPKRVTPTMLKAVPALQPTPSESELPESEEVVTSQDGKPFVLQVNVEPARIHMIPAKPPVVNVQVNPTPVTVENNIEAKPGKLAVAVAVDAKLPDRKPKEIAFKTGKDGKLIGATIQDVPHGA